MYIPLTSGVAHLTHAPGLAVVQSDSAFEAETIITVRPQIGRG